MPPKKRLQVICNSALRIESQTVLSTTASKCAGATASPSDAPVVYNHAYGGYVRVAGKFPLVGNYTTKKYEAAFGRLSYFYAAGRSDAA